MVIHHADEQNEQMMYSEKTIVEISSHLSCRKSPNDDQTSKHCTTRKSSRSEKNQAKNVLIQIEKRKGSGKDDLWRKSDLHRLYHAPSWFHLNLGRIRRWKRKHSPYVWLNEWLSKRIAEETNSKINQFSQLRTRSSQQVHFFIITRCED